MRGLIDHVNLLLGWSCEVDPTNHHVLHSRAAAAWAVASAGGPAASDTSQPWRAMQSMNANCEGVLGGVEERKPSRHANHAALAASGGYARAGTSVGFAADGGSATSRPWARTHEASAI